MAPTTNAFKVKVSRLKLGSDCCAMGCVSYIYLFVATNLKYLFAATISKLTVSNRFSKRLWLFWINMSTARFKIETQRGCFYIYVFFEGNRLSSENFPCHFHFILPVMPDKAAFVSSALLCLQSLPGKPLFLPLQKHLLLAENELAFSISPSDLRSKHILLVIRNNLL